MPADRSHSCRLLAVAFSPLRATDRWSFTGLIRANRERPGAVRLRPRFCSEVREQQATVSRAKDLADLREKYRLVVQGSRSRNPPLGPQRGAGSGGLVGVTVIGSQ